MTDDIDARAADMAASIHAPRLIAAALRAEREKALREVMVIVGNGHFRNEAETVAQGISFHIRSVKAEIDRLIKDAADKPASPT